MTLSEISSMIRDLSLEIGMPGYASLLMEESWIVLLMPTVMTKVGRALQPSWRRSSHGMSHANSMKTSCSPHIVKGPLMLAKVICFLITLEHNPSLQINSKSIETCVYLFLKHNKTSKSSGDLGWKHDVAPRRLLFLIENLWGSHGQEWASDTGPT